jgi:ParB-like chromosome segregation protein Spo0J
MRCNNSAIGTKPQAGKVVKPASLIYVPTNKLHSNLNLERILTENQILHLAVSIGVYGLIVPLTVDRDRRVIIGCTRLMVARRLGGAKKVPAVTVEDLNSAQVMALTLADNVLTENCETWFFRKVRQFEKAVYGSAPGIC